MIETFCKKCVFKILNEDGAQTGCFLNRTSVLPIKRIDNENCIVLGKFCNTYRPDEWLQSLSFDEAEKSAEIVLEEVVPRIGFLINFDTSKSGLYDLESTLLDIVNQKTHKARYVIIINHKVEYNPEIQKLLTKYFNFEETKYHITQIVEKPSNDNLLIDEASGLFLNGWLYVTTSGEKIKHDFIETMHQLINFKMKSISIILPYNDFNGLVFQTALFKFLCGNKKRRIDEDIFDDRPFLEKAKGMESSENAIFTWEEINAIS